MGFVSEVLVATTKDEADDPIVAMAESRGVRWMRGSPTDVLGRFLAAAGDLSDEDCIVRVTADNAFYDPDRSLRAFEAHTAREWDYTHVDGLSHVVPEFIQVWALRHVGELASDAFDREHVTPYLRKHREHFRVQTLPRDFAGLRGDLDPYFTIDHQEQLEFIERMLASVETNDRPFDLDDCYAWVDRELGRNDTTFWASGERLRASLAGREVGDGMPCFIVAEIGQNHNGEMAIAKRLIEMAARCGADAVKFQKRDLSWELTEAAYNQPYENPNSFGATYGKHREFLELSEERHLELKEYALAHGLMYFCTACDEPSVDLMERIGNPVYKVASRDLTNIPLLRRVAKTRKPVILSTGMATMQDIRDALDELREGPPSVMITHCVSEYPTSIENVNLRAMKTLRDTFHRLVGLSDHTVGIITGVAAAVMGAFLVEKHVTLSRAMKGTDQAGALEEEGLRRLVKYTRECEAAMGDGTKAFVPAAEAAKRKLSRSLTSRVTVPRGTELTEEMLILKSPGTGLPWRERVRIVGRTAKTDIPPDTTLSEADFD
jgi:sialic acid synthase SpsE/spore coat polysaccharide biosynthesis protein SpsF (cytidylyltransferase family)